MNSSHNPSELFHTHFARDAGIDTSTLTVPADPIAAYLALMEVVEQLRPQGQGQRERECLVEDDYTYRL